jgi:hypothetical protein
MRYRLLALAISICAAATSAARAEDAPKPLRTLTYDVSYSLKSVQETTVSGLTGGNVSETQREQEYGRGAVQRGISTDDRGTLQVDVVAATSDGGLVVDASYTGRQSKQLPLRVAIYSDGRLAYDPSHVLSTQALHVLPMLARGVIAERDVSPGSTWSQTFRAPVAGTAQYRVTHRDDTSATIVIAADMSVKGVGGFDEHDDATTRYSTERLCPLEYDVRFRVRRTGVGQSLANDGHVVATLVSDTFAKK